MTKAQEFEKHLDPRPNGTCMGDPWELFFWAVANREFITAALGQHESLNNTHELAVKLNQHR